MIQNYNTYIAYSIISTYTTLIIREHRANVSKQNNDWAINTVHDIKAVFTQSNEFSGANRYFVVTRQYVINNLLPYVPDLRIGNTGTRV